MKLDKVKAIAKERNITAYKLKKAELIRAIQCAEGNEACFETGKASKCEQHACLWREDCV